MSGSFNGLNKVQSEQNSHISNQRHNLATVTRRFGLHNADTHFNCFLNVGLQIIWNIDALRESLKKNLAEARRDAEMKKMPEFGFIFALNVSLSFLMVVGLHE